MINLPDFDQREFIQRACEFIKDEVEKSNTDGVVVGLSGGIDSTVVAYLAVKALGSDNVKGYIMPSLTTSDEDIYDAQLIQDLIDIETTYISIGDLYEDFVNTCKSDNSPENKQSLASANIKPRLRMSILYYYATLNNYLVIGTGNKTELLVGYFTKYGDGGVDLLPIGDLYKEEVQLVAQALGVPDSIINKAPTAGLWPGQTDESELGMTYPVLDRLLYLYNDQKEDVDLIADALEVPVSEVERIIKLVENSSHKRDPIPILPISEDVDEEDDYSIYVDDI
ncbi:MAG: NAD+ synthase [Methanosphaera sp.]|nr:NAD+ synthase [Methanosphaera sp.]